MERAGLKPSPLQGRGLGEGASDSEPQPDSPSPSLSPEGERGKGRALSFDDVMHYQRIIKILCGTDRIMREIVLPL
jgi:hypothetical protein